MSIERLWAPWRMDFIRNSDDQDGCFLCKAASEKGKDRENGVVRRGCLCFAILNRYPYNNGHLLLCPVRHVAGLEDLTADERAELMAMVVDAKLALDRVVGAHGYNIGANLGRAAGAGLEDHFHLHLVPRWSGDVNFMTSVGSTKVIPQALDEMWELLSEEWNRADA